MSVGLTSVRPAVFTTAPPSLVLAAAWAPRGGGMKMFFAPQCSALDGVSLSVYIYIHIHIYTHIHICGYILVIGTTDLVCFQLETFRIWWRSGLLHVAALARRLPSFALNLSWWVWDDDGWPPIRCSRCLYKMDSEMVRSLSRGSSKLYPSIRLHPAKHPSKIPSLSHATVLILRLGPSSVADLAPSQHCPFY